MKINSYGNEYDISFVRDTYVNNGSLYVGAIDNEDGCLFCSVTVNLPASDRISENDCAYLDTNNAENVIDQMIDEGYIEMLSDMAFSGFCCYPLGRFTEKFFKEVQ